jgi:LPS export ABC transporter protein LptC
MSVDSVLNPQPPSLPPSLTKRLRPVLLVGTALLVILKIVALTPAPLEELRSTPHTVNLDDLMLKEDHVLAPGIPRGRVPDYSIEQFNYVSTQAGQKQWNLLANEAFMFNAEKLMHAKTVKAFLYDTEGKITVVTGLEAKYMTNQSDLEVFGDVKTTFPDGFVVASEYMRYKPKEKKVEIPMNYAVSGEGEEKKGERIRFTSRGLDFAMDKSDIFLPADVKFTIVQPTETTILYSDYCLIHRKENIADYSMNPNRPNETRFVQIKQPTMYSRGRTATVKYGSAPNLLQNMTLFDDVFVKEFTIEKGVEVINRYGTGGRGDFDSHRNVIILTIYPQVYQDEDTMTGDKITMHRDSDIVETEHGNGFKTGNDDPDHKPSPHP